MKKLLIIHTGGTISMERDEMGKVKETEEHPLHQSLENTDSRYSIDEWNFFQIPSPHITFQHMLKLKQAIEKNAEEYDGIIITHGTDTMEETAFFIDLTVALSIPIIFTGAMRSSNEIGADGPYNLQSAIHVALHEQAHQQGVLVVMNDQIHQAHYVMKKSSSNLDAFKSINYGPIGRVHQQNVHFFGVAKQQVTYQVSNITKNVLLIKTYVGMTTDLFANLDLSKIDGIVIEALGQGNVPPSVAPIIEDWIHKGIPVIITSRCPEGVVLPTYYYEGGGGELEEKGAIFSTELSGQKSRIKLLLLLEINASKTEIVQAFQ
ncbi:L-asparaginase [Gracilibacillus halotolerans]|uniref:asparaginase n=1 Tax=Gracilibacillus halotolerans TaxID=74386 RepID=A0A841RJ50_9BACI|nr:asparaginase [Gracilibacillus halotolerans]MBB6511673.1 L-asparaginase [Gracilibacillus halotolerans]